MYTFLMLPAAVRAEVPATAAERRSRRERRDGRSHRPAVHLLPVQVFR